MRTALPLLFIVSMSAPSYAQSQDPSCASRILVSGFFSNEVHVYDGCDGRFLRLLDNTPRGVAGAQATRLGPDGLLWAVAEGIDTIQRYHPATLDYVDSPIRLPGQFGATGLDFGPNDEVYIASYNADTVRRYDIDSHAYLGDAFAPNTAILNGPDNGMTFGPDGRLYIPGFDSHSVAVAQGSALSTLVPARTQGLQRSRGILFERDGLHFLLTAEGSNRILRVHAASGQVERVFSTQVLAPTGIAYAVNGDVLVATQTGVLMLDPQTGAIKRTLIGSGSGGLVGPTFITVLPPEGAMSSVDGSQIGTQYWVVGSAQLTGRVLQLDDVVSATGTGFGDNFDAADVTRKRWGSMRIEFTACDRATLSWNSSGPGTAGFGNGGYPLERLFDSAETVACRAAGFAQTGSLEWVAGTWYAPHRSGEGILLDKAADHTVFMAWFTHQPE